jgi:hypothetical protein
MVAVFLESNPIFGAIYAAKSIRGAAIVDRFAPRISIR